VRCSRGAIQVSDSRGNNFGGALGQSQQLVQTLDFHRGATLAKSLSPLTRQSNCSGALRVAPASDLQRAYFSARIEDFLSADDASVLGELTRRLVYTPPQEPVQIVALIVALMTDLERFINGDSASDADPPIKMAVAHHHFHSIHPFCDGDGAAL